MASEKRLIDTETVIRKLRKANCAECDNYNAVRCRACWVDDVVSLLEDSPTVDAVEVGHGRWVFTTHEEYSNYRWNVTAECSECHLDKGEIWAGFFPGFPKELAAGVALANADCVKMDNYCPNCGAKMDGDGNEID